MSKPKVLPVFKDFDDLNEELDFLFNNYFKSRRPVLMPVEKGWKPPTDMYETDEEIVITMDIAGITTTDVSLRLEDDVLAVRGIRREHGGVKRRYHHMEIDYGPFERLIELPSPVDPERTTARYFQGFLEIKLVKRESPPKGKLTIEIS